MIDIFKYRLLHYIIKIFSSKGDIMTGYGLTEQQKQLFRESLPRNPTELVVLYNSLFAQEKSAYQRVKQLEGLCLTTAERRKAYQFKAANLERRGKDLSAGIAQVDKDIAYLEDAIRRRERGEPVDQKEVSRILTQYSVPL